MRHAGRSRSRVLIGLALVAACGTDGGSGPGGKGDGFGQTSGGHIDFADGQLLIDGKPTFLYGGDLHYFRVHPADLDPARTFAMWGESLDAMRAAGMNLVTTYMPWDYHQLGPDRWDFTGARDVGHFLDMACDRGLHVIVKPGPLILAEWPRGFGSYGGVPEWWKAAHPEALVRTAKGDFYSFSFTGDAHARQPTYLDPSYLAAVKEWYRRALEIVRPHLGKCLVGIQIDNETNLYWGDRFGAVDYAPVALDHYHHWLADQYGSIVRLNARYGTSFGRFADVAPPTGAPGPGAAERAKNPWYADWYWAGQAYVAAYQKILRDDLSELGFDEPDVFFTTNDSPFPITYEDLKLRSSLLQDGPTKSRVGLPALDLYPKQIPTSDALQDQPFQADFFTKLAEQYGEAYLGGGHYTYAAELQGGFYAFPVLGRPKVRPEATDQLLARAIGNGLKGGAFYVFRDGLNVDGSAYAYDAAMTADGKTTARYDVLAKWGRFLGREGANLLTARAVDNRVAILVNGAYQAPQGGILDDLERVWSIEGPALFGFLIHAGISPAVLDARLVDDATLARYRTVFYLNPDVVDDRTANLLTTYVAHGGALVDFMWPGRVNQDFHASPAVKALAALFPATGDGFWAWPSLSRAGHYDLAGTDGLGRPAPSFWYESFWKLAAGAGARPFAWERQALTGAAGKVVGFVVKDAQGTRALLGTNPFARFDANDYYGWSEAELGQARQLARFLAGLGGERPLVAADGVRELAWARRADRTLYLFVVNDNDAAASIHVALAADALGLAPGARYTVREGLGDRDLGGRTGAELATGGVTVDVAASATAVVVIAPE